MNPDFLKIPICYIKYNLNILYLSFTEKAQKPIQEPNGIKSPKNIRETSVNTLVHLC